MTYFLLTTSPKVNGLLIGLFSAKPPIRFPSFGFFFEPLLEERSEARSVAWLEDGCCSINGLYAVKSYTSFLAAGRGCSCT